MSAAKEVNDNSDEESKLLYEDSSCSPDLTNENILSPELDHDSDKSLQNIAQTSPNLDVTEEVGRKEVECKENQGYGDQDLSKKDDASDNDDKSDESLEDLELKWEDDDPNQDVDGTDKPDETLGDNEHLKSLRNEKQIKEKFTKDSLDTPNIEKKSEKQMNKPKDINIKAIEETDSTKALNAEDTNKTEETRTVHEENYKITTRQVDTMNTEEIRNTEESSINKVKDTSSVETTNLEIPRNTDILIKTPGASSNTVDEINKDEKPPVHSPKAIVGKYYTNPETLVENPMGIDKFPLKEDKTGFAVTEEFTKVDAKLDSNTKDNVPTNLKEDLTKIPSTKDKLVSKDDVLESDTSNKNSDDQLQSNQDESLEIKSKSQDNKTQNKLQDLDKSMSNSFIKTVHELNKPDAMLEIPSQELIDFDEADLSLDKTDTSDPSDHITDIEIKKEIIEQCLDKDSTSVNESITEKLNVDTESSNNNDSGGNKEEAKETLKAVIDDVQPSTSKETTFMTPDTSDEVPEVSDSLGLLAESSGRMMEDDDDDDDDADEDDGDDYDQDMDESSNQSNQVSPEPLEDSNAPEIEIARDEEENQQELEIEQERLQYDVDASDLEKIEASCTTKEGEDDKDVSTKETSGEEDEKIEKEKSEVKSSPSPTKLSPSKVKKLEITSVANKNVLNIVDLEESSSEDDVQEVKKEPAEVSAPDRVTSPSDDVTSVNIPESIDIMSCSGDNTSEIVTKQGEVVINGVPKPPPPKTARLNTGEVTIKTATNSDSTLVIPETKLDSSKPKVGLEIFNLDSDDEETAPEAVPEISPETLASAKRAIKCVNYSCTSGPNVSYKLAGPADLMYFDAERRKRTMICEACAQVVSDRTQRLVAGIKDMTPLLHLDMEKGQRTHDLVEISDSDSEDEEVPQELKEVIGVKGAKLLEANLADFINDAWAQFNLSSRLDSAKVELDGKIEKLDEASKELNEMLDECQVVTDKLRSDLYATFEPRKRQLPAWSIIDTLDQYFIGPELDDETPQTTSIESRAAKRRSSATVDSPAKKPAIPLGYTRIFDNAQPSTSQDTTAATPPTDIKDDDKDISVVKLSVESAPPDLPPPGILTRPPLRVGMSVYAMKNAFGPWLKGKVIEIQCKTNNASLPFTMCRVKFDHKMKVNGKVLPARCIAYNEPAAVRMTIGTRLIGLFKDTNHESYYSGVVAEVPNPVNNYRYLVFFDDGYAQYVQHCHTRLVCECSPLVWEEVHPFSREFVKEYLMAYPERPMVRLHEGQHLKTEWNGKWWSSKVVKVDASLARVLFIGDGRQEWIYRGSTRLAPLYLELKAAEKHRPRTMPRSKGQTRSNMPYVEYTRSDEQEEKNQQAAQEQQKHNEEMRRQRAVAKKSTTVPSAPTQQSLPGAQDTISSRVVYYTPKNAVKPHKMVPHVCSPRCKRSDVLTLLELRTYNPLAKPLLSGWERQIVRYKGNKEVMYRTPCGRRVRTVRELHRYLRLTRSDLPVDLFDFHPATHCLAEFVLNKCIVGKKDLSHGKENVPVPCVNYYDDSLPEFCLYNTERTPTAGVPLNLDPEFLCGCDCIDDCQDKTKCACWKMTLEGARTIGLNTSEVGYVYKRLPEPLPSGIYECNSRCKCKHTCLNRVAQHPLQLKLQVFKTLNRGWGIRALNDVPKGAFLCVYAGNLLTDATANLDGLNEGDEYLAELDYIEVVEQMKEGYEEDISEQDKKLDKKEKAKEDGLDEEVEEESSSEEEEQVSRSDKADGDFTPGCIGLGLTEFSKRLRKRQKNKDKKDNAEDSEDKKDSKDSKDKDRDDCITISDDEEIREPSRFTAQPGMGGNASISKYRSVRSLFGEDEACYIMDAKVQGNIGRYLNHSCTPNVFVQNVFVDTHDPRFPWVAFFALSHIKAGTELTWNYNYDVGSVPGKILYCYCGAPNCRGRLL